MTGYGGDFDEVRELFRRTLQLAPEEREAFLARATDDAELRAEVASILEHVASEDQSRDVFDRPWGDEAIVLEGARRALEDAAAALGPAHERPRIPRFTLGDELGRGAVGVVYRAQQEQPQRTVALKVFDHVLSGSVLRLRFEREMNVLARLDHRGIPRVFDAGVTHDGSPWFAMELVDGLRLLEHAEQGALDRPARVQLVAALCRVVDHAHRKGVIHRDIKPDNIVVDRKGRPCVLDFGIARVMDVADAETHLRTEAGQVLGTLSYMSPEQADGRAGAIDIRTDVYALGAVLYELLTGRLPCDTSAKSFAEALAAIRLQRPAPLKQPDEDLQTVLDIALSKERDTRYATACDLADDLERWLSGRPVLARPPGRMQRVRSFLNRHRAFSVGAAAAAVLLVVAFALSFDGWWRARASQQQAAQQRRELLTLSDERRLQDLIQEAGVLWPPTPELAGRYEDWMQRAQILLAAADGHREVLEHVEADLGAPTLNGLDTGSDSHPLGDASGLRWQRDTLRKLLAGLDALDSPNGFLRSIRLRHATAANIRQRTIEEPAAARAWAEAAAAVAASPLYGGLVLPPQVGLLPLGPDPSSGLWEFAHLDWSGEAPGRDPQTGLLQFSDESSLVLVLLPGGVTTVGAQSQSKDAPNHDPLAFMNEGPVHRVQLDPFFISKYEITRKQWRRLAGPAPGVVRQVRLREEFRGPLSPAIEVTWTQSRLLMQRHGLALPTEAQWEYAARGGSSDPWPLGSTSGILAATTNAADLSKYASTSEWTKPTPRIDDGQISVDPVDARPPNLFGLHGIHGNVWEFCEDVYLVRRTMSPRAGDGLLVSPPEGLRSARGGSYNSTLEASRVSSRTDCQETQASADMGVRPIRRLDGGGHAP